MTTATLHDALAAKPKSTSPFQGFYNHPLPHDYFSFLRPVGYRAPDETMGLLRPWLAQQAEMITGRPIRILDFFCGYGANGLLLRTGYSIAEVSALYAEGDLASTDFVDHQRFFSQPMIDSTQVEISGLDIAPNALRYAHATGIYQRVFDDNLIENAPSPALAKVAFDADIIIESGGHHEISAPIIDRLLSASNPDKPPPLIMSVARDFDFAPISRVLTGHNYRYRIDKPDFMLRRFADDAERKQRQARNLELGLPKGGVLGDNVRYANLYWAEAAG
jgi:hypothetical protein